jgi:putative holliday junction resolvase
LGEGDAGEAEGVATEHEESAPAKVVGRYRCCPFRNGKCPLNGSYTEGMEQEATILGIDYGRARIGLAIAEVETRMARPLDTLARINRNEDMRRLREVVRDHCVRQIVVGLPLRLDGTQGEMAEEAARFATRVRKQLGVPVEMVDERLTSWEAERLLEEQSGRVFRGGRSDSSETGAHRADRGQQTRKTHEVRGRQLARPKSRNGSGRDQGISVDSMAATLILQDYLAQLPATHRPPKAI